MRKIRRELSKIIYPDSTTYPYRGYCDKYRIIFVHIPKCAGTSICAQLSGRQRGRVHADLFSYQSASPRRFREYFKFTFVRNPYTRFVSAFNYLKAGGNNSDIDKKLKEDFFANETLDSFTQKFLSKDFSFSILHLKPQWTFLESASNDYRVDKIYRVEEMSAAIDDLNNSVKGLNLENKKINSSRANSNELFLSEEVREKVKEVYKLDFEKYYPEEI